MSHEDEKDRQTDEQTEDRNFAVHDIKKRERGKRGEGGGK